jgi:hypothetical protein
MLLQHLFDDACAALLADLLRLDDDPVPDTGSHLDSLLEFDSRRL